MKNAVKMSGIVLVLSLLFLQNALAKIDLDYPELLVTPKASERIALEAKNERENRLNFQLPVTISASMTLIAGIIQAGNVDTSKDEEESSPMAGIAVGAGWLAINYYLAYHYDGYMSAYNKIKALPAKNNRQRLLRERMAEEEINRLGRLGRRIKWLSFVSNLGASVYMLSKAEKDSTAITTNLLAAVASFGPVLFSNEWSRVACEQKRYKKKIYGSLAVRSTVLMEPSSKKIAPGALVSYRF